DPLVVAAPHAFADTVYEARVEPRRDEVRRSQPAVDEVIEDEVGLRVGEAELSLIGLPDPKIRRRRLADDDLGHSEQHRELTELRLVEIAHRIEIAGHISVARPVSEEQLRLVARPEHEAVRPRPVVLDRLA